MTDIKAVKKLLEQEYGIRTAKELYQSVKSMDKACIGVFTAPVSERTEVQNEETRNRTHGGCCNDVHSVWNACSNCNAAIT